MAKSKKPKFATEADLCSHFVDVIRREGWVVYPETAGFDLLLVATPEVMAHRPYSHVGLQPGDQVGVEAKLQANIKVLDQAMPKAFGRSGPEFHAVLLPMENMEFMRVAARLGVLSIFAYYRHPEASRLTIRWPNFSLYARTMYEEQCWTPDIPVETAAGVPSPRRISKWKLDAVRFCILAQKKEFVLSTDFTEAGLNSGTFVSRGWFVPAGKIGRMTKYVVNPDSKTAPHVKYPEVAEAVRTMLGTEASKEAAKYLSRKRTQALSSG